LEWSVYLLKHPKGAGFLRSKYFELINAERYYRVLWIQI